MGKRILIVEDELAIAQAIHDGLQDEGFPSEIADSGEAAAALELSRFALVLLDIRLPGMDGYELCRLIRQRGHKMPVIFVSARDDVVDRILGLELGADDYIVKPFSFRELLSRIKAQLRRAYGTLAAETDKAARLTIGHITVDQRSMRVYKDDRDVYLTPIEYRLLQLFLEYPGQVLSRDQIIEHVWGDEWSVDDPRGVNVHMRHLREKIEADPAHPQMIMTVRGYGYRFDIPE
ncbi:MAG: response regulator transcription factor [Spirochaetia bacterium]|nr:response regulator transcription factor [Spirochaetia bacterium]